MCSVRIGGLSCSQLYGMISTELVLWITVLLLVRVSIGGLAFWPARGTPVTGHRFFVSKRCPSSAHPFALAGLNGSEKFEKFETQPTMVMVQTTLCLILTTEKSIKDLEESWRMFVDQFIPRLRAALSFGHMFDSCCNHISRCLFPLFRICFCRRKWVRVGKAELRASSCIISLESFSKMATPKYNPGFGIVEKFATLGNKFRVMVLSRPLECSPYRSRTFGKARHHQPQKTGPVPFQIARMLYVHRVARRQHQKTIMASEFWKRSQPLATNEAVWSFHNRNNALCTAGCFANG